jgi:hypothetical protein
VWNEAMKGHGIARSQRSPRHRPPTPSAPPPAALGRILSSLARLERRYDALSSLLHMYMGGWDQSAHVMPIRFVLGLPHLTPQTTRRAAAPDLAPQTAREADSPLVCVLGPRSPKHGRNRRQAAELARAKLKKALALDRLG